MSTCCNDHKHDHGVQTRLRVQAMQNWLALDTAQQKALKRVS